MILYNNSEEPLTLHKAYCIDTNDPDKLGRVQIRIIPHMEESKVDDLPWYEPYFGTGNSNNIMQYKPPVINSNIIVLSLGKSKRNGYYISEDHIQGFFKYDDIIKPILANVDELSDDTYDNIHFELLQNGNLHFYHKTSKEQGLIHSDGSYIYLDASGKYILNTKNQKIILKNNLESIKTLIDDLIDEIKAIITIGSPASQSISPASQVLLDAVKTRFGTILEE